MRASEVRGRGSIPLGDTNCHMHFNPLSIVEPSATLAMNALAQAKKAKGERVYNLSAGEPMLAPHPAVIEAATNAMKAGKTRYPPVAGIPELLSLATAWSNDTYGTNYASKNALVTCGGKFGLYGLCQALLSPGDKVLIIAPYWVSYPSMVKMFGGEAVIVETSETNGWKLKIEDLRLKINAKVLILNNGGNPTGVLYSRDEIKNILEWAKENGVVIISDEVYSGLTYDGEFVSCGSFPEYSENVIIIQSCSKHFAMTGWRVGFVFGTEEIIQVLTNIQSQSTTGTASISQWAAVGALENAGTIIPHVNSEMKKRRDTLVEILQKYWDIKIFIPSGLYAFVSMKSLGTQETDSVKFCTDVLEKANVAMVPGAPFGQEGYVRMSFGETEKELSEAVEALAKYLK